MKIIDADVLSESLRRKLGIYEEQLAGGEENAGADAQVDECVIHELAFRIRGIRGCLAELRDAVEIPQADGTAGVVHCRECRYGSPCLIEKDKAILCTNPCGLIYVGYDGYCSKGERK